MFGPQLMIVRTPQYHTSAALGGMPAKSCPPHRSFGSDRTFATAFPAPQNCGAVKAGWARKASGLWDGCTRQQHSAPPREYLLVFKDIDMKRAEESSALIRPAHQLHPLEFRSEEHTSELHPLEF